MHELLDRRWKRERTKGSDAIHCKYIKATEIVCASILDVRVELH